METCGQDQTCNGALLAVGAMSAGLARVQFEVRAGLLNLTLATIFSPLPAKSAKKRIRAIAYRPR